jgi:cell division protein FtsQ
MNKFKKIVSWVLLLLYLVVMLSFTGAKKREVVCESVKIQVVDGTNNFFIEEKDVLSLLHDKREVLVGKELDSIDVNKIEEVLLLHPSVKQASVYRTLKGEVKIKINQRNPILRIINKGGDSFYVDEEGKIMPLSNKYTAHVVVASGNINLNYTKLLAAQKAKIGDKSVDNSNALLLDLYELASYIYHDEFWNAQIEQIYVNRGEFELIPRVGTHVIKLGSIENYTTKFRNLRALYLQGLPRAGWNNYSTINLKYNNQVICTKR